MDWLITPPGIPVLVAIVGVISGIVGGAVSQIVAGIFKTRGDTRVINAAKVNAEAAEKRWQQEQEFARKQYLLEARRTAFVHFLHEADLVWTRWHKFSAEGQVDHENLARQVHAGIENLSATVNELGLYDESIAVKASDLLKAEPIVEDITAANFKQMVGPWNEHYRKLQAMMRRSIGIEVTAVRGQTPRQLTLAPESEDKPARP